MSVRQSVLALLAQGPRHGAWLKTAFEASTGGAWPLNVGQVYTTLARLERDDLVRGDTRADEEGRIHYRLTEAGRRQLQKWWQTPVDRREPARDELVIKLALAISDPDVDPLTVLQTQRSATMRLLQTLTHDKIRGGERSLADELVQEHRLFAVEAELRWLDHVEATLARRAGDPSRTGIPARMPVGPASGRPTTSASAESVTEQSATEQSVTERQAVTVTRTGETS